MQKSLAFVRGLLGIFADSVRDAEGGPVADVGCGPGHVTAHLRDLGLDAFGIDLSPGMVKVARRDHPGVRFEVGSMTDLDLPDASVGGLIAWFSLIHVPDDELGSVLAQFRRVVRPGGYVLLGFHAGEGTKLKTKGYGGHPMKVSVHRREPHRVAAALHGFAVEAEILHHPAANVRGGFVLARAVAPQPPEADER